VVQFDSCNNLLSSVHTTYVIHHAAVGCVSFKLKYTKISSSSSVHRGCIEKAEAVGKSVSKAIHSHKVTLATLKSVDLKRGTKASWNKVNKITFRKTASQELLPKNSTTSLLLPQRPQAMLSVKEVHSQPHLCVVSELMITNVLDRLHHTSEENAASAVFMVGSPEFAGILAHLVNKSLDCSFVPE